MGRQQGSDLFVKGKLQEEKRLLKMFMDIPHSTATDTDSTTVARYGPYGGVDVHNT